MTLLYTDSFIPSLARLSAPGSEFFDAVGVV